MEIKLVIDKKEKTFTVPFVSARMLRKSVEFSKTRNTSDLSPEDLDEMADYTVDLFGAQFTRDNVYDGLSSHEFIPTVMYLMNAAVSKVNDDAGGNEDPNVRARA
ncbi:phage tail assembly chaperone G [Paenibacillus donghaensis]|uniref:Phage tail assembly protein n=1 Tax=Paenibacillus donghaensis TaxID=414771 RepID=A0A2Z2KTX0_9BACL|nr:hypothetical protein [Paenibacillus donghaensis]ASA25422.1 hypothetical protein B9T62_34640 [Paenibacillus donghaensis]